MQILSCKNDAPIDPALSSNVISKAFVLTFDQLEEQEQNLIDSYCSYSTGSWMSRDLVRFSPQDGYFVKAIINIDALSRITVANQCGTTGNPARCSEKELSMEAESLIGHQNPRMLYGKYKNSWVFISDGKTVPPTEKFDGHRLLAIRRDLSSRTDDVLIGPLPIEPDEMIITLYSSTVQGHEPLKNPVYILK